MMIHGFEEFDDLFSEWEAGSLDDQGLQRLREILKNDSAARSRYVDMQLISAALYQSAAVVPPATLPSKRSLGAISETMGGRFTRQSFRLLKILSVSIPLAICLILGWSRYPQFVKNQNQHRQVVNGIRLNDRDATNEPTARGVALVTRLVDVIWADEMTGVEVGQALPPGRFAFQEGYAQIEFFSGATLVVEGPAELQLTSSTNASVLRGRIRADVPPAARGFSLEVDGLQVVDLGTEFGVSKSDDRLDIQVFDGEVELHPQANQSRLLTTGQAVMRTNQGEYQEIDSSPESYIDIAELESRVKLRDSARYGCWKTWSEEISHDSRLIAYYDFDASGDWKRRLKCTKQPVDRELDGALVGARKVHGRWQRKGALEFKQPADRVRVQISGEYGSLTFATWVKIDSLDRWYNSLFLTDGYDKGEPHWQILDDGRLYFSVRPVKQGASGPRDYKALSPPFWKPSLQGKWIHLAVTCDLEANTIIHYLNGDVLSRHTVPGVQMPEHTKIGKATIGNWVMPTQPDNRFAIRNLNGSLDEMIIFAAALSAEEIKEIYEYGKP